MSYSRTGTLLGKKFTEYLFPTIMGSMSILLAAFVDGIIVSGIVGSDGLSAVNLAEPVVLFMQAVFFLFGIGGAVSVSIAKGQRDVKKADKIFTITFVLAIATAVITTVAGALFVDGIVNLICNDATLINYVRDYVLVTFYGSSMMIFVPYLSFIIRTDGMPKFSANILLVANAVNLVMDFVYMKLFNMGTGGAALATVTGYVVGLLMELFYLFGKNRTLHLVHLKPADFKLTGEICGGGIASTLNTVLLFVKAILLNQIILSATGTDGMAVFSVCNFTVSFVSMFISGGSDTMTPIAGMLYGEKDYNGLDFVLKRTLTVVVLSCVGIMAVMLVVPQLLLSIFSITSPEQVEIGMRAVRIYAASFIFMGMSNVLMNYYQVTRQKAVSVLITIVRGIAVTVPCVYIMAQFFGEKGMWWAFVISEFLSVVIALAVCKIKAVLAKDKYSGILLHERLPKNEVVCDISFESSQQSAVDVSKQMIDFCNTNGIAPEKANLVGILSEEIIENVRQFNDNAQVKIDFICRIMADEILVLVRDNGKTLESVIADEQSQSDEFTNLKMIKKITTKTEYSRALGLNNTFITLGRN